MKAPSSAAIDYLCVDAFLSDVVSARALATALEVGLIDLVPAEGGLPLDGLHSTLGLVPAGLSLLVDLLRAARVVKGRRSISLTPMFRRALKYRDLMQTKLDFAEAVVCDFHGDFTKLLTAPGDFIRNSRTYNLFRYDLCLNDSDDAFERARRWVAITTGYTRYEARVLLDCYDVSPHRRMLDIGGNSGELTLALCRHNPELTGLVLDLPAVCRVGREHVAPEPEARRVSFLVGSGLASDLPLDRDLITFKSMLHDWPEREAARLIERAVQALAPGGTLLIFERGPFKIGRKLPSYALLPCLLFFHCYRESQWYVSELQRCGLVDVERMTLELDSPYHLVIGRKR